MDLQPLDADAGRQVEDRAGNGVADAAPLVLRKGGRGQRQQQGHAVDGG